MNNPDPVPTDDPREISRVCPACKGRLFVVVALGPNGEQWACSPCALCEGRGEITRAHTIRLWREVEDQR